MFLYYIKTIKKIFLLAKFFTKSKILKVKILVMILKTIKNPFISEWILKKNNTI